MSGKNILWKLLDGHPKLFVNAVHSSIGTHFLRNDVIHYYEKRKKSKPSNNDKQNLITINLQIDTKHTLSLTVGDFFESLYKFTSYRDLYTLSKNNILITNNQELASQYYDWNFEIEKFEKYICKEIFDHNKNITIDKLITQLQELYCKANNVNFKEVEYFVDSLPNDTSILNTLQNNIKNFDIIFLKRNSVDLCYANTRRNLFSRNNKTSMLKKIYLNKKNLEFYYILNQYNFYYKHIHQYIIAINSFNSNKKYLVVEFEKLILDTKNTMKNIVDYLKINPDENLFKLTSNGKMINEKNPSLNNINDKAKNIFSKKEIIQIEDFFIKNIKYKNLFIFKLLIKVFLKKYI